MEALLGKVNGIEGKFFAEDANGDVVELKNGDEITQGMTVFGDSSNSSSAMITVAMEGSSEIVSLSGSSRQLFDNSLVNEDEVDGALAAENVESASGILSALEDSETTDKQDEAADEETAAGEENVDGSGDSSGVFAARDGSSTDIAAGLRDATFTDTTVTVEDQIIPEPEPINVILTLNDVNVLEGSGSNQESEVPVGTATIGASLDTAPTDGPIVFTLSNGATVTFTPGYTPGNIVQSTQFSIQGDDVYVDGESYPVSATSYTGGTEFTSVNTTDGGTVTISDTIDPTTITLHAPVDVDENATSVQYTVSVDHVPEAGNPLTVEVTVVGEDTPRILTITNPATTATFDVDVRADDVYFQDAASIVANITDYDGGNYEAVTLDNADNTVGVNDDFDETTITLAAPDAVDENATSVTYTVSVDHVPEAGNPLTVEVTVVGEDTPRILTITNPATTATFDVDVRADDVYFQDAASIVANITDYDGGNYEAVTLDNADNTVGVNDDFDPTTANITVNIVDSLSATVSVQLSNLPQAADGNPSTATVYVTPDSTDTLFEISVGTDGYGEIEIGESDVALFVNPSDNSLTVSFDSIVGGNYENVVGTTGVDYIPEISVPAIGDNAAITADAALDSSTGSLDIDYGDDGAAAVNPIVIEYTGGLGDATNSSDGTTTTITAVDGTWVLTINESTGAYTFDQTGAYTHDNGADSDSGFVTVTITDADGDTTSTQLELTITDDVPTVTVEDLDVYRSVGTTSSDIILTSGADSVNITEFLDNGTLTWDYADSSKYSFDLIATDSDPVSGFKTYAATYNDGADTFFEVTVNNDGTYDFNLLEPAPSSITPSGELFGSIENPIDTDADGKNDTAIIDSSNFGGAFSVEITGSDDAGTTFGGDVVITKSNTDIGVDGNSLQENQDESMRFSINREVGYSNVTLDSMTINASETGSFATGSNVSLLVTYTTGDPETLIVSAPAAVDTDGDGNTDAHVLTFDIDTSRVVDHVDLSPADNNLTMKIVGVSMDYTTVIDPADQLLNFTINGEDSDGDAATAGFSVNIMSGTAGDDTITTAAGPDNVSTGEGDDTITYDPDDTVDGGVGYDTLTIDGDMTLDFSTANIENIEAISLETGIQNLTLSLDDVLKITTDDGAGNHTLDISAIADDGDTYSLDTTGWTGTSSSTSSGSIIGETTYEYTNNDSGDSITLTVDDQIDIV